MKITNLLSNLALLAVDETSTVEWSEFTNAVTNLISTFWKPAVAILGALCAIYAVFIGIKFWNARGDEGKLKEAKSAAWNFGIGLVAIFLIAGLAPLIISALSTWIGD